MSEQRSPFDRFRKAGDDSAAIAQPGDPAQRGKAVAEMRVLAVSKGDGALMLQCPECNTRFAFREDGGSCAVERATDLGPRTMAQCPKCHAEWGGEVTTCYALATLETDTSPQRMHDMVRRAVEAGKAAMPLLAYVFDVVEAENPVEALKKASYPDDHDCAGVAVVRCPKFFHDQIKDLLAAQRAGVHLHRRVQEAARRENGLVHTKLAGVLAALGLGPDAGAGVPSE